MVLDYYGKNKYLRFTISMISEFFKKRLNNEFSLPTVER